MDTSIIAIAAFSSIFFFAMNALLFAIVYAAEWEQKGLKYVVIIDLIFVLLIVALVKMLSN